MMSETEETYEAPASANPFDESDEAVEESVETVQPEIATPASPASTKNPFESDEVDDDTSRNPFEEDVNTHESERNKEDYKCVSLDAPAMGLNKAQNGDWDLEWEHVSAAVKKNFSSISVVAPELISSMMSK